MGSVASFNYAAFIARYPEFSTVSSGSVQACFNEAGLYLRNDGSGQVTSDTNQALLMNMVTAHIVALNFGVNGQAPTPLVGRISSAAEGSVSVSVENLQPPGSAQWFAQTKYGAAYWAASAPYRGFKYKSARVYNPNPRWPMMQ